jgi:hypoxanthine phosphoribosyltransferase
MLILGYMLIIEQNKDKPKKGTLPEHILKDNYLAARTVGDVWICYPWEAIDIEEHDAFAAAQSGM